MRAKAAGTPKLRHLIIGSILGLNRVYIRIMEKKMETTIIYWVHLGIMEKKMETTIFVRGCALTSSFQQEVQHSFSQASSSTASTCPKNLENQGLELRVGII